VVVLALLVLVGSVLRVKRVSPMSWGWYGTVCNDAGVAIKGYDAVAYHRTGQPTPGDPAHGVDWHGGHWLFATAENQALFAKHPEKYAPQFGGFCSFAASKGFTAKCDPTAWKIEGHKLYLFNDASMRENWIKGLPQGSIAQGEAAWATRPTK
jgi:hypothetical protein